MLKIKRLNRNGNEMECLVKIEDVEYVTEKEIPDQPLFDEDGNQVDTKHNDNVYLVSFKNGTRIFVTKETYDKLETKLSVETL